ncbi:GNAT family N-acetyltransferase [Phenylobacterium sp. J426]|uniref:GNAT family N-acetyltransferase n=1 Tax=Phenylobacterium sp. J426 TaxID=2898439 RepID=UPI00215172FF|nr:GNAT family N-acetyltransferase [Phenylobacterium sp. J426]MCR5873995.1 GNAT family N-acetyltransferase [Phenylobacterium sp. J426]
MKLRVAEPEDAPLLAKLHAQAFERPWDTAAFVRLMAGSGAFGLLAEAEAPLGLVLCRALAGEAEILTVAVPPPARRRGVAKALMTAALGLARESGAQAAFLEVDVDNAAAIGLYEGLGFERAGLRKAYYDRGAAGRADALVMRLDLGTQGH